MKIAIEGQRLFRKKKHGMDFVALELVKNLQHIDLKNEYYVFVKPDEDKCLEDSSNFHIIELPGKTYPYWEQAALSKAVKKYGCDLLHCTSNTAPVNLDIPLVVTVHDIIYLESVSIFKKGGTAYQKFGNLYRRWNVPRVIKNAKYVITVSKFEKSTIDRRFPDYAYKIVPVYNGVSEHFKPVTDKEILAKIRKKYNLPEEFIFFLGNTDPKKNTRNVLKAFATYVNQSLAPLPLVLIDFGKDNLLKMLREIGAPALIEHIRISGYISNTDLPAIYSLSSLFLYPSLRESFGIPLLEGMRCGVPVISSNTSSMPEIGGDGAMLIDPYHPEQISDAMSEILSNHTLRKEMTQKGFERAAAFSWENMAKQVLELYKNI
ncbi:MAG: glycosyltransferase family 4 protein [Bacteroidales bacterium]|nr:glycosyltransferase family 4 protein [Bacteroidales bacterium]